MNLKETEFESVENYDIAKGVIKSLRSASNSSRFYKQNAINDDNIIPTVVKFNEIIKERKDECQKSNLLQTQMNEAMQKYDGSKDQTISKSVEWKLNDLSDDDEDDLHSKNKPSDYSDDEPTPKLKVSRVDSSDDDLMMDDEDMQELMKGFTAPVNCKAVTKKIKPKKSDFEYDEDDDDELVFSNKSPSASIDSKMRDSQRAGVRGIQDLMKKTQENPVFSPQKPANPRSSANKPLNESSNIVLPLKAGQSIRVRAPGRKNRTNKQT